MTIQNSIRIGCLDERESSIIKAFSDLTHKMLSEDLVIMKLFGSRSRGKGSEWSDLDILLVLKDYSRKGEIFDLLFALDPTWEFRISPIVMSLHEYERNKEMESLFIKELERDGILL